MRKIIEFFTTVVITIVATMATSLIVYCVVVAGKALSLADKTQIKTWVDSNNDVAFSLVLIASVAIYGTAWFISDKILQWMGMTRQFIVFGLLIGVYGVHIMQQYYFPYP